MGATATIDAGAKVGKLRNLWRNRRHLKIHFFGCTVIAMILIFLFNLLMMSVMYNRNVARMYANTAVFTPSTITTLSATPLDVMLFRINEANDQMFILLKLADMSGVSANIDSYELYVTNATRDMSKSKRPVTESLSGQYYMFGATGYVGIYIYVNDGGQFTDDYKWITVRTYTPVTGNKTPALMLVADDANYDQYHIFVNPGSETVQTMDFLENHDIGATFNGTEIYTQMISENLEWGIKNEIAGMMHEITDLSSYIMEYRRRLSDDYGLELPPLSPFIAGDHPDVIPIYDANGNEVDYQTSYKFASVVPGGIDIDWYGLSLRSGYYHSLFESNLYSLGEYLSELKDNKSQLNRHNENVTTPPNEWRFADGTPLDTDLDDLKPIISEINVYNGYLNQYIAAKTKIQRELFVSLLDLEFNTNTYMGSARILSDKVLEDGSVRPALLTW